MKSPAEFSTNVPMHHRIGHGITRTLRLLVLASGPVGAVFGFLAWQEAKSSSPDMTAAARNTAEMLRVEIEVLRTLGKALPEAERTRLGIERLITIAETQLAKVPTSRKALDRGSQDIRQNSGWWNQNGPGAAVNALAVKLWKDSTPN